MLSPDDFSDGLDEPSVVLYVTHLCSRLLEVSKEDRAAALITQAMRRLVWMRKYGECLLKRVLGVHESVMIMLTENIL